MQRTGLIHQLIDSFESLRKSLFPKKFPFIPEHMPTPAQVQVILFISNNPNVSITQLAEALGISGSAATQHIDQLVEKGIVSREESTEDRRKVTMSISDKACTMISELKKHHEQKFLEISEVLTDEELSTLIALINKMNHRNE